MKYLNDTTRAMIIAFFPDIFTLIQQFGIHEFTTDQLNIALSVMTKLVVFFFYIVKTGQGGTTDGS